MLKKHVHVYEETRHIWSEKWIRPRCTSVSRTWRSRHTAAPYIYTSYLGHRSTDIVYTHAHTHTQPSIIFHPTTHHATPRTPSGVNFQRHLLMGPRGIFSRERDTSPPPKEVDDLLLVVALKTQVLTVTANAQNTLRYNISGGGAASAPCPSLWAPMQVLDSLSALLHR